MTRRAKGTSVFCLLLAALAVPAAANDDATSQAADTVAETATEAGTPGPGKAATPAPEAESASGGSEAPAQQAAVGPAGHVERARFTTAVVDREPTDAIETLDNDRTEVAFFTELRGFAGETVTHRWEHGGEVAAEVPFQVGGPRWRTYSTKQLDPAETGQWTVSVVDASGQVLESASFEYREAAPDPGPPAPEEAAPASVPAAPAR